MKRQKLCLKPPWLDPRADCGGGRVTTWALALAGKDDKERKEGRAVEREGACELHERVSPYNVYLCGGQADLESENTYLWNIFSDEELFPQKLNFTPKNVVLRGKKGEFLGVFGNKNNKLSWLDPTRVPEPQRIARVRPGLL